MRSHAICIGAQKAGTTWLHQVLSKNPRIWVPPFKEVHFFDHLYIPENRRWTKWHIGRGVENAKRWNQMSARPKGPRYVDYLDSLMNDDMFSDPWYRRVFSIAPPTSTTLDVTPAYLSIGEGGVEHVKKRYTGVKIICLVRDPVDRAISQVRMTASRLGGNDWSLEDWLEHADSKEVEIRSDYRKFLPIWRNAFGEDLLILPFKSIKNEPHEMLLELERFLGLPGAIYEQANIKVHEAKGATLPDPVVEFLERKFSSQRDFLGEFWGKSCWGRF
ncbi:sulfotransferase family protein [Aliiroseovarius sp.]|uniref:sulfotransferase family protein n=1 Tax=Aliiroseovarius sp. TaxID=1872442 RepID=UPI003BAD995D